MIELATQFENLQPDVVLTVADRFETIATAIAASYMNIPVAHTQGGEVTGSIDESVRHAVTKLSHIHFPATERPATSDQDGRGSGNRAILPAVRRSTSSRHRPVPAARHLRAISRRRRRSRSRPALCRRSPASGDDGIRPGTSRKSRRRWKRLRVSACRRHGCGRMSTPAPTMSPRALRRFREHRNPQKMHFYRNFAPEDYARLQQCACLIGNSCSALREGAFLGVPAVNIGTRQSGREHGPNVVMSAKQRRDRSCHQAADCAWPL